MSKNNHNNQQNKQNQQTQNKKNQNNPEMSLNGDNVPSSKKNDPESCDR